jgi:hypothetical protein
LFNLLIIIGVKGCLGFQTFAKQACDPWRALLQDQIDQVAADDASQFGEHLIWYVSHRLVPEG